MSSVAAVQPPEALHPALWRASQLARSTTRCIDTGHAALSAQLPGGGWPVGTLVDLHVQQPGIGEVRLLAPALRQVAARRIVFLQPPHAPQAIALAALGIQPSQLLWLRAPRTADALWAAEQVLKNGGCGALLYWPNEGTTRGGGPRHVTGDSLRRLHLAAQLGETLFFMLRPLAESQNASPAPLRLALRPAAGGIDIEVVKRRGPQHDGRIFVPMTVTPVVRVLPHHVPVQATAPSHVQDASAELVR